MARGGGSGLCAPEVGSLEASRASAGDVENLLEVLVERIEKSFGAQVSNLDQKPGPLPRRGLSVSLTVGKTPEEEKDSDEDDWEDRLL